MPAQDRPTLMYLASNGTGKDILAYGVREVLEVGVSERPFEQLRSLRAKGGHLFGILSYELKDALEHLESKNPSWIDWPALMFFRPKVVLSRDKEGVWEVLESHDPIAVKEAIQWTEGLEAGTSSPPPRYRSVDKLSKSDYLSNVKSLKEHIQIGDIYEANFCQEWRLDGVEMDALSSFRRLMEVTRSPFAAYFYHDNKHLLSGSPELYLQKEGTRVMSSPIKGTRGRGATNIEDASIRAELRRDKKERAENIMITDLVRNDLSRTALRNSVIVEELCRIHSFDTVHQMISKVTSQVDEHTDPVDIVSSCFPMGSMTGAPKVSAMELIEKHETFKRGLYSGAVGYFSPDGDFQFNVVIRSIQYDSQARRVSIAAGGAITSLSDPEMEYEESLLKADAMLEVMGSGRGQL